LEVAACKRRATAIRDINMLEMAACKRRATAIRDINIWNLGKAYTYLRFATNKWDLRV
jgi:hypothetical protein